jgi:hypothetical protein
MGSALARHLAIATMSAVVTQALIGARPSCAIFIILFGLRDRSAIPLGLANRIVVTNLKRVRRKRKRDERKSQGGNKGNTFHLANSISV